MPPPADRPRQRADARENRARILDIAITALQGSPDISLNSIAKDAGVGIGTLYRHFPSREALLVAVYHSELDQLATSAATLLDTMPPWDALVSWLGRLASYGRAKSGFTAVLANTTTHDRLAQESYEPIVGALGALLSANEKAGAIRAGVDPDDVLLMLGFLWRVSPDDGGEAKARRLLGLVLDGLRAGAPKRPPSHQGARR
jgi:AcrR family transcriptional regulator